MKKYKIYFRINEYLMINDYDDRSEHAYTERMVHGRAGEKISGSVRQMVRQ